MTIKQKLLESIQSGVTDTPTSIDSILEGTGITPEIQKQLAESFEASVVTRANEEVAVISEMFESKFNRLETEYKDKFDKLDEEFKSKQAYTEYVFEEKFNELTEEYKTKQEHTEQVYQEKFNAHQSDLNESVASYLDYTAEEYLKRNALAIETGLKTEITEGFISGLKSLFESNYIEVPEERADFVSAQEQTIEDLKTRLKEAVDTSIQYKKRLDESQKHSIVDEFTTKLTDTEMERFKSLSEEISFTDEKTFRSKLAVINENYFKPANKSTKKVDSFIVSDTPVEQLNEAIVDPSIAQYVSTISQYFK